MSTSGVHSQYFLDAKSILYQMSDGDVTKFAMAFFTSMCIGAVALAMFLRFLSIKFPPPDPNNAGPMRANVPNVNEKKEGEDGAMETPWEAKDKAPTKTPEVKMPTKIPRPKRNIPAAAAAAMVERGDRLRAEDQYGEGLKCYLSLLFAAVEQGPSTEALPQHLTSCLRGAVECYKGLDDYANAVRFLQAERMIYEEMVAQEQKKKKGMTGSAQVLATLFSGKDPASQAPHRAEVLTEVAEASLKHGYGEIGLSYRVKAAAVKQKMSGKQLDPESPEYTAIAEAMETLQKQKAQEAENAGAGGDVAPTAGGSSGGQEDQEEEDLVESTTIRRRELAAARLEAAVGEQSGAAGEKKDGAKNGTNVRRRKGKKKDGGDADAE